MVVIPKVAGFLHPRRTVVQSAAVNPFGLGCNSADSCSLPQKSEQISMGLFLHCSFL